jgi:hypothetical protein
MPKPFRIQVPPIQKEFKFSNSVSIKVYNDLNEASNVVKKHEFIFNPVNGVMDKLIASMVDIVQNSNGMLKGFHLFKDTDETFGQGKYPKR